MVTFTLVVLNPQCFYENNLVPANIDNMCFNNWHSLNLLSNCGIDVIISINFVYFQLIFSVVLQKIVSVGNKLYNILFALFTIGPGSLLC